MSKWLKSREMQVVFTYSAWTLVPVGAIFLLALGLGPQEISTQPVVGIPFKVLAAIVAIAAVLGLQILYWGMLAFCIFGDRSSVAKKVLWVLGFLTVNLLATFIYFFAVYKRQVKVDDPSLGAAS